VAENFIYFAGRDLREDIGEIVQDQVKPFFSEGHWSMHELLLFLLGITGPARVWLSTFSISEDAIRAFSTAMDKGMITQIHCLFDYTIQKNKLGILFFAYNTVSDITITANHSKLILIQNDSWKVSVVGSANMTPNPRKEAGVIFTTGETFDHYLMHLQRAFAEGTQLII
jgi:hypothetical protein